MTAPSDAAGYMEGSEAVASNPEFSDREPLGKPRPKVGRPSRLDVRTRRKEFVVLLAQGVDPATAAEQSGHPAHRALQTLSELGFILTVLEPEKKAA